MTGPALQTRLSASAWRLAVRLPADWRSSARRRRLLFLALCGPGFIGIAALPAHRNIWVLLASLASMAVALTFRRLSEPVFLAQTGESHA